MSRKGVFVTDRPTWDLYFLGIAKQVATRATCDRKHVGAVIVRSRTILATGYNGSPRGIAHCDEIGHQLVEMNGRPSCIRTVHAEMNAIAQAARMGVGIERATLYTTASTCWDCAKLVINAGIVRVVAAERYASRYGESDNVDDLFRSAAVTFDILPVS